MAQDELKLEEIISLLQAEPDNPVLYVSGGRAQLTAKEFETLRNACVAQVQNFPFDENVIGNAAALVIYGDRMLGEQLFQQAQQLNPKEPKWTRRLAQSYRYRAMSTSEDFQKPGMKAIIETKKALNLKDSLGEKAGLLIEAIPLAIKLEQCSLAKQWCNRLARYARECNKELGVNDGFTPWVETSQTFLATVALKNNNRPACRRHVRKMLELLRVDKTCYSKNLRRLRLIEDLIDAGEISLAAEALTLLIELSEEGDKDQLQKLLTSTLGQQSY